MAAQKYTAAVCSQSATWTTPAYLSSASDVCEVIFILSMLSVLSMQGLNLPYARDAVAVDGKWIWNSISRLDTFAFYVICDVSNKFKCLWLMYSSTYHYQQQGSRPQSHSQLWRSLSFTSMAHGLKNEMKRLPMNKVDALWRYDEGCVFQAYFK